MTSIAVLIRRCATIDSPASCFAIGGFATTAWTQKPDLENMEFLYNPDLMPEEELTATFVARQWLVDELISLVAGQPNGAGVQHVTIIAPRGMGKTTVLL